MPEWSEIRLMSDHINKTCKDLIFEDIVKNPVSKQTLDRNYFSKRFKIEAFARGKEIQIRHTPIQHGDTDTSLVTNLTITMGMSGNFVFKKENDLSSKWPMLTWKTVKKFKDEKQNRLELVDHRRFAKWMIRDWNPDRGYDMITEHDQFSQKIMSEWFSKNKDFKKPLCEILMSQKYFNGLGNYLLAEILGRLSVNPFQSLLDLKKSKVEELIKLCKQVPIESYLIGGGEMRDWKNQEKSSKETFADWLQFYKHKNSLSIVTNTGRNFWYNKRWKKDNIYELEH